MPLRVIEAGAETPVARLRCPPCGGGGGDAPAEWSQGRDSPWSGSQGHEGPRLGYKGHEGSLAVVAGAEPPDGYTGVKPCFREGNPKREGESSLPFGKQATR